MYAGKNKVKYPRNTLNKCLKFFSLLLNTTKFNLLSSVREVVGTIVPSDREAVRDCGFSGTIKKPTGWFTIIIIIKE